jgi:hypothetical protein
MVNEKRLKNQAFKQLSGKTLPVGKLRGDVGITQFQMQLKWHKREDCDKLVRGTNKLTAIANACLVPISLHKGLPRVKMRQPPEAECDSSRRVIELDPSVLHASYDRTKDDSWSDGVGKPPNSCELCMKSDMKYASEKHEMDRNWESLKRCARKREIPLCSAKQVYLQLSQFATTCNNLKIGGQQFHNRQRSCFNGLSFTTCHLRSGRSSLFQCCSDRL